MAFHSVSIITNLQNLRHPEGGLLTICQFAKMTHDINLISIDQVSVSSIFYRPYHHVRIELHAMLMG